MSDAYSDYCEEQQKKLEKMKAKIMMDGIKRWNSISDSVKREKLEKIRSDFMVH